MAFVLPTFNLTCNWWDNSNWRNYAPYPPGAYVPGPDATYDAALRFPSRATLQYGTIPIASRSDLLLPALTNVGTPLYVSGEYWYWADVIEVPAGSGRYYFVEAVEDTGKGYANEYRVATVCPTWGAEDPVFATNPQYPWAPFWPRPFP